MNPILTHNPEATHSAGFFLRDVPALASEIDQSIPNPDNPALGFSDPAKIVAQYMVTNKNPFGAAEWKQYFGVDVGPETPLSAEFYQWWNGPDPLDVYNDVPNPKPAYETHLTPIFAPQFFPDLQMSRSIPALERLGLRLAHTLNHENYSGFQADSSGWLVMRKNVLMKNKSWEYHQNAIRKLNEKTKAGYKEDPSIVDIATVILPYRNVYREPYLGESSDPRLTCYSHARETVREYYDYRLAIGVAHSTGVGIGHFSNLTDKLLGFVPIRQF